MSERVDAKAREAAYGARAKALKWLEFDPGELSPDVDPIIDAYLAALVEDTPAEVVEAQLRVELAEAEQARDSLRLERDGLEQLRRKDNEYLVGERDRLRVELEDERRAVRSLERFKHRAQEFERALVEVRDELALGHVADGDRVSRLLDDALAGARTDSGEGTA